MRTGNKRDVVGGRGLPNGKMTIIKEWKGEQLKKKNPPQEHKHPLPEIKERERQFSRQKKEHKHQVHEQKPNKRQEQIEKKEERHTQQQGQNSKEQSSEVVDQKTENIRSLSDIVMPLLIEFTLKAAGLAATFVYDSVINGLLWICNQFAEKAIPYAVQNLPKILFVTKKQGKPLSFNSSSFDVLDVDQKDYDQIPRRKEGKTRVVVPLGTENDGLFLDYLEKNDYRVRESVELESEDGIHEKQGLMIPSESFEAILKETEQSYEQLLQDCVHNKEVIRLQNCCIFEMEGENTMEQDLLDNIVQHKDTKEGYIIVPEHSLKRSGHKLSKGVVEPEREKTEKGQIIGEQREGKARVEIESKITYKEDEVLFN